jgi:hypothetical protein
MSHVRQTKKGSLIEAGINILIGFCINYIANLLILPLFGFHVSLSDNFLIGLLYTGVSVARSYAVRRWFDARIHRAAMQLSKE